LVVIAVLGFVPGLIVLAPLVWRALGRRWPTSRVLMICEFFALHAAFNASLLGMWGTLRLDPLFGFGTVAVLLLLQPLGLLWAARLVASVRRP